jgi:hypothetical protein
VLIDVRIIRDRQTSAYASYRPRFNSRFLEQSRQFGFLRFPSLDAAMSFMDRNYPILYLYGDNSKANGDSDQAKVRLSYGKERKEPRTEEGDWVCPSVGCLTP